MRWVLTGLAVLLFFIAIALLSLPWWLGAALRPLAREQGVAFARYERLGYARFALHDLTVAHDGFRLKVSRLEADAPWRWLTNRAQAELSVGVWNLQLIESSEPGPKKEGSIKGLPELHARINEGAAFVARWLPRAHARQGVVQRGGQSIAVGELLWTAPRLTVAGVLVERSLFRTEITLGDTITLTADLPNFDAAAEFRWKGADVSGTGRWWGQPISWSAQFPDDGWLPEHAQLAAENWDIPGERFWPEGDFERLRGRTHVRWQEGNFEAEAQATASPKADTQLPPLDVTLQARGGPGRVEITQLNVQAPFATGRLSAPVAFDRAGRPLSGAARFQFTADLAAQPWITARGHLSGEVVFAGAQAPVTFGLRADDVQWRDLSASRILTRGSWRAPVLQIEAIELEADGATLRGNGELDWERRRLNSAHVEGTLTSSAGARWLPAGLHWERAHFRADAAGPLASPEHRGEMELSAFAVAPLRPLNVRAQWRGRERTIDELAIEAEGQSGEISLLGRVEAGRAEVHQLELRPTGASAWRLTDPASIAWSPEIRLEALHLTSDAGEIRASGRLADEIEFRIEGREITSRDWQPWLIEPMPEWQLGRVAAQGKTHRGVVVYSVETRGVIAWQDNRFDLSLSARGDERGVELHQLDLGVDGRALTRATGRLPILVRTIPRLSVQLDDAAPLEFSAELAPDSPAWTLVERTGWQVERGKLQMELSGTLVRPNGSITGSAASIQRIGGVGPDIEKVELLTRITRDGVHVESLRLHAAGQPLTAEARLPMTQETWRTLFSRPAEFDWQRAEARVAVRQLALAEIARTFPAFPFISGTLDAHVALEAGRLQGELRVAAGNTRPLPGLGVLQSVWANVALADRTINIEAAEAEIGGEPLRLAGFATWHGGKEVTLDLRLAGRNVPLVRRPGALVRSQLDLRAQTGEDGLTRISGVIELADSLVMADLADILPGGPRGSERTPPYFSVEAEPFARWPLDVAVRGPRALRVRTAVFNGVATPRFQLTGTLGDPRAIGQVSVDEGRVLFPFATFAVQQGAARITASNPHEFQLNATARTRRHGYDLIMEAGGTLQAPTVTLTSNPPLDAADVLLMVTTGQPPTDDTSSMTTQQRLTRLGTFIGRGLFQNLGGADESRLDITSGQDVSRQGRETYNIEYRLNRRWAVTGEYDEYDNYNAGVKWRIYTQGGRKDEP
jgi:translocation and assembly module TamB